MLLVNFNYMVFVRYVMPEKTHNPNLNTLSPQSFHNRLAHFDLINPEWSSFAPVRADCVPQAVAELVAQSARCQQGSESRF